MHKNQAGFESLSRTQFVFEPLPLGVAQTLEIGVVEHNEVIPLVLEGIIRSATELFVKMIRRSIVVPLDGQQRLVAQLAGQPEKSLEFVPFW